MADWYVSSVDWAALPQWAASTAYTVGQIIRPLATPTFASQCAYRCTTAGTSAGTETGWQTSNNATTNQGTAVFTNVSGQGAYGWAAVAGNLLLIGSRAVVGDRVFIAHTHNEANNGAGGYNFNNSSAAFGLIRVLSVNRSGSVPPVEADLLAGATITYTTTSGGMTLEAYCDIFYYGITFALPPGSTQNSMFFNQSATKSHYLKNCAIYSTATGACRIAANGAARVTFDNTTVRFNMTAHTFSNVNSSTSFELHWINTPNAIQGSVFPATLFTGSSSTSLQVICRGVDLSAITGTLMSSPASAQGTKLYLDSCKIHPSVTRYGTPAAAAVANDEVELINCYDGTNILNERYGAPGSLVTDRTTYRTGGADDGTPYSFKLASSSRSDKSTVPLDAFWLDTGNTDTGTAKTATVEIVSSASLNNDDISLLLEYLGTASSSVASFTSTLPATPLTTASALPSSSATWTASAIFSAFSPIDLTGLTLSGGNLVATTSAAQAGVRGADGKTSGKFYWEYTYTTIATNSFDVGIATAGYSFTSGSSVNAAYVVRLNGAQQVNGSAVGTNLGTVAVGNVIGVAVDFDADLIWFRLGAAGNWNGSGTANPATGTGGHSISALTGTLYPLFIGGSGDVCTVNFGASAFTGSVPSGFTSGLPATPVKQYLQATFTPQQAGRIRGLVKLGKTSTTCWVDPRITVASVVYWTPASVATLGWYDASSASNLVISGSNTVDQWSDLSGKGNHVLGPTGGAAGTKPTYTTSGANQINGLNTVLFNGFDNLLVCYDLAGFPADNTTAISCVCVFRARSLTDRGHLDFTDSSVLTNHTAMLFSETGNTSARCGGTGNTVSKAFSDTVNPHLWSTVHGASDRQIRQDGGTATTNSSTNTTFAYTNFRIGRLFQDVYPMLGDFAELIIFQGTNSTTREKCEGYLAHKWGLASGLPSGHPYKSSPPTV